MSIKFANIPASIFTNIYVIRLIKFFWICCVVGHLKESMPRKHLFISVQVWLEEVPEKCWCNVSTIQPMTLRKYKHFCGAVKRTDSKKRVPCAREVTVKTWPAETFFSSSSPSTPAQCWHYCRDFLGAVCHRHRKYQHCAELLTLMPNRLKLDICHTLFKFFAALSVLGGGRYLVEKVRHLSAEMDKQKLIQTWEEYWLVMGWIVWIG